MAAVTVYWVPGCVQCMRIKNHLAARGVDFESVEAHADSDAMARLRASGTMTVPAVEVDGRFFPGGDVAAIEAAIGLTSSGAAPRITVQELARRTVELNRLMLRWFAQVPAERLDDATACAEGADGPQLLADGTPVTYPSGIPYEPHRTIFGLVRHIVGHVVKLRLFVEDPAEDEWFADLRIFWPLGEPDPETDPRDVAELARGSGEAIERLVAAGIDERPFEREVESFHGRRPIRTVLYDNTYSTAQHVRQLASVLGDLGIEPDGALDDGLLEGFRLPAGVWS